ncbi:GNAT family N-acetyltransferase [Dietzia sp.]|uniref:GNAT family N-acetyltransferase n=1 Tax=Dietzia sp. TaxID=1871616 RepID=UPI002FDA2DBE
MSEVGRDGADPADSDTIVVPVDLLSLDRLDTHSRACVFWQTDGDPGSSGPCSSGGGAVAPPASSREDRVFEKEAWLSSILLQWGVCGLVAENLGRTVGTATYGPTGSVPRTAWFGSGEVGSDAVVLAEIYAVDGEAGRPLEGVRDALLAAVVADIARRGVKAIETFGLTEHAVDRIGLDALSACGPIACMAMADFFLARGFEVVGPHEDFPRLRLEIDGDHEWQEDVEYALDQLLFEAALRPAKSVSIR